MAVDIEANATLVFGDVHVRVRVDVDGGGAGFGVVDLHRTTVLAGELDKADIPAKAVHVVGGAGDGEWASITWSAIRSRDGWRTPRWACC